MATSDMILRIDSCVICPASAPRPSCAVAMLLGDTYRSLMIVVFVISIRAQAILLEVVRVPWYALVRLDHFDVGSSVRLLADRFRH